MKSSVVALLFLSAAGVEAWSTQEMGRRQWFGKAAASVGAAAALAAPQAAQAATAKTGAASPFTGDYEDPNHPGCLRQVKVVGAPLRGDGSRSAFPVIEIVGWDGNGDSNVCKERPTREQLWKIQGTVKSTNVASIDFSPKGGPANLVGKFEDGGIVFPDGNKWTKLSYPTNDRRPKDMTTLKSD